MEQNPQNKRPSFDDPNPTISDPLHSGPDGHSGPEPDTDTADVPGTPASDEPALLAEQAMGAGVMFDVTKRRIVILLSTLIRLAESGDFALWCPLSAMDESFRGLNWASVPPLAVAKFYKMVAMALTTYGSRLDEHAMAVLASIKDETPLPELPVWRGEDTVQMYDYVDQLFAVVPAEQETPNE